MESPFNKGFGPGHQSPALSHAPPAGSAYQVNVNRTKTRKWVEARVQSYDGDDWGADEYSDDDGPEPEPSVQQSSSQIPAAGTDVASPPIHHPTQGPHPPSVASLEASEPSTTKKPAERDKTVSSQFTGAHSSSRLVESDGPSVGSLGARSNPPHADRGGDGGGRDSASPQLPDVARMSSFGVDLFTPASGFAVEPMIPEHNRYDLPLSSQPPRAMEKNQYQVSALESGPSLSSPLAQKTPPGMHKKLPSASHSLKEVNSGKPSTNAKSLSENTIEEPLAEIAFTNSDDTGREPDYVPSRSTADAILAHPQARQPALHLESGWPTIPPLRTPSPRASAGDLAGQGGMFNVTDSKPSEASDAFQYKQHDHELEPISLQRQLTASTIVSSPGKDNDILSDEILRSLSSGGSSSADPSTGDGRKSFLALNPSVARNSSYTLQDYDSYWADTSDKAPTALPRATALESKSMVVSSSETPGPDEHARVGDVDSRKRFSWEAEEGRTNSPSPNPPYLSSTTDELAAVPLARAEQGPTPPPNGVGDGPSSAEAESPMSADTASGSVAGSDGGQEPLQMPQPPSPPTVSSDRQASVGRDCEILSCPDEGARAPDSSSVFSPTPPPEFQTSLADQPPSEAAELQGPQHPAAHAPSMTFREILGLPARAERIARYNETRNYFASADTGLNAWLTSLQAQNPEYANGPESLARTTSYPLAQAESHPSSANAQPPAAQQPYYQQYLNATAPSTSSASRSRPGGPPMPSQSTGSAFGHPSHQIGFKSKEFMHSAGKMGKGLLSKGKNKLRGSGDKGESAISLVHTSLRTERRSSWAFSLGARSRPGEAGPATFSNASSKLSSSIDTRRHGEPSHLIPLAQSRSHDLGSLGKLQPVRTLEHLDSADRVTAGLSRLDITGCFGNGAIQLEDAEYASRPPEHKFGVAQDQALDDWVVVSRQGDNEKRGISTECNLPLTTRPQPTTSFLHDDGSIASQVYSQVKRDVPKRDSSFVGLPPVRMAYTFGIATRAKRASRRFSLDDDDVRDDGDDCEPLNRDGSYRAIGPEEPPSPISSPVLPTGSLANPALGEDSASGVHIRESEHSRGLETQESLAQSKPEVIRPPALASFDAAQPVLPRVSPTFASPIPGLATGPWKLEESHLSEPLHSVTRHRPGTGSQQQPMFYGYDKETGSLDHLRQRPFDVPPSSAQRWPDLFSPIMHDSPLPRSLSQTTGEPDSHPHATRPLRQETEAQRTRNGKPDVDTARILRRDSGRNQQGLGIFKQPAIPATRALSRSRRALSHEARPTSSGSSIAAGGIEETTMKRKSFLLGLTGGAPANHGSTQSHGDDGHDQSKSDAWASRMPWRSKPHGKSPVAEFGSFGEATSSATRRSSHYSFTNDPNRVDAGNLDAKKMKNRLSSMVNLASFRAAIYGSGTDHGGNSQPPRTASFGADGQLRRMADLAAPASAPFHSPARSSTVSSFDPLRPLSVREGGTDKGARGSSVSGLLLDLLGHKPGSKPEGSHAPRHAHSSSDLQARRRKGIVDMQSHSGVSSPVANPHNPPLSFSPAQATQQSQGQATSVDALSPPPGFTTHDIPLPPAPLGLAEPVSRGGRKSDIDRRLQTQGSEVVPKMHGRNLSAPLLQSQHDGTGPHNDGGSPLAGIGAQHDAAGEAAFSRSSTVSPDLSVASDRRTMEQQDSAGHPRVSNANFSIAGLESQLGQPMGDPGQARQSHAHQILNQAAKQRSGSMPPQNQRERLSAHGDGGRSRWKDLRARVSEQIGQPAPESQGKPEKVDKKTESKFLGAFKRISRSLESTRGAGRQEGTGQGPSPRQQPHHPFQSSSEQTERQKALHPVWTITPAQSQQSSPFGACTSPSALSPLSGPYGQPSKAPAEPRRHDQWEPVYDQVPIPGGYQAAHGEALVAPMTYSVGNHTASGLYARPHQQPHGGYSGFQFQRSQLSPPISQESPLRHDSVSSLGMGSSSLSGPADSRAVAGLGVVVPHQPSMNFQSTWQGLTPGDPEATERHRGLAHALLEGHGRVVSSMNSNADSSVSADATALCRSSRSPILHNDSRSPTEDESLQATAEHRAAQRGIKQDLLGDLSHTGPAESLKMRIDGDQGTQVPRTQNGEHDVNNVAVDVPSTAELDDTTKQYERSRRLESQEEKILFRAEDADDYQPQMSATSWPGQEWNPYGEPGFGDWRED